MKKNLLHIIFANLIYMLLVAGLNFILPKFTSVETYAAVKEYTLYITTYSSILTLGYIEGMYLKYGGKKIEEINSTEIGINILSFLCFMLPISICISVIGILTNNYIVILLGAGILSNNMISYYQMFYQATGDFKSYGGALNASRIMILLVNILLIFCFKIEYSVLYVLVNPIIGIIIAIYLTLQLNKKVQLFNQIKVSFHEIRNNIKSGFVLMIGNFITSFFSSVDRWFIKGLMETFYFAMYSFAVSMENIVNTFMTPITVSMYNYFCTNPTNENICKIKDTTLIYSFIVIALAFPAKWIIENFMIDYLESVKVIFPLFAAQGISTIIKGIYVNKYKAEGKQKKYLFQMIAMLLIAIILNIILYMIFKGMTAIAIATLITNIIWLIICEVENREIRYKLKAVISMIILLMFYIFVGYKMNSIIGCIAYCIVGIVLGLTLMQESFLLLINSAIESVKTKLKFN